VGGGATHNPRRPTLLFVAGDPDSADLRAVFRLAYRQAEGLIGSIISLLGLTLRVPDHTTLSRRSSTLAVPRPQLNKTGDADHAQPLHLLVDSIGLKLCGAGEWLVEKHGTEGAGPGESCTSAWMPAPARWWLRR
jgi:Transposase DDE domain